MFVSDLFEKLRQAKNSQAGVAGTDRRVQIRGQFRMIFLKRSDLFNRRGTSGERKPCDGTVGNIGSFDDRFVCGDRIFANLLQPRVDSQHRILNVGANGELKSDVGSRVTTARRHLDQAFDRRELLFLFLDDLAFDFARACSGPTCVDGDDRILNRGNQLLGHRDQ